MKPIHVSTAGNETAIAEPRAIGPRFFSEQDRLRGGPPEDLCAPNYRAVIAGSPPLDLAGHQQFARAFYAAFPDLSHTVDEVVGDGDSVAVRFTIRGTHAGDFFGVPASGRPIEVSAIAILRVVEGRVTELRGVFDQMTLMKQLGALPSS